MGMQWQDPGGAPPTVNDQGVASLSLTSFREALLASQRNNDAIYSALEMPTTSTGGYRIKADDCHSTSVPDIYGRHLEQDEEEVGWADMMPRAATPVSNNAAACGAPNRAVRV